MKTVLAYIDWGDLTDDEQRRASVMVMQEALGIAHGEHDEEARHCGVPLCRELREWLAADGDEGLARTPHEIRAAASQEPGEGEP